MEFINQNNYPNLIYPTNVKDPGSFLCKGTVSQCGCGLCCVCMVLEHLTGIKHSVEEILSLSMESGANVNPGTSMEILGPAVCEKYGIHLEMTNDTDKMTRVIESGGIVIVNVGGNHDDHLGTFSDHGHFILVCRYDGNEYAILDPAYSKERYSKPHRSIVRIEPPWLYASARIIEEDSTNRDPRYYLFSKT